MLVLKFNHGLLLGTKRNETPMQASKSLYTHCLLLLLLCVSTPPPTTIHCSFHSALEFARTTTSLILSDEKDILREIAGLQRLKNQIEEYNACEGRVQEIKGNLNNHRDALKKTSLAIDELEKAIAKVRMAKKLGCAPAELMVVSVDCPAKKIGLIIGRNGANIKMIEEKSHVSMDVDSVKSKIHLTGSHAAIQAAIVAIDRVVKSIDEEVHVSDDLITYMTSKVGSYPLDTSSSRYCLTLLAVWLTIPLLHVLYYLCRSSYICSFIHSFTLSHATVSHPSLCHPLPPSPSPTNTNCSASR